MRLYSCFAPSPLLFFSFYVRNVGNRELKATPGCEVEAARCVSSGQLFANRTSVLFSSIVVPFHNHFKATFFAFFSLGPPESPPAPSAGKQKLARCDGDSDSPLWSFSIVSSYSLISLSCFYTHMQTQGSFRPFSASLPNHLSLSPLHK